MTEIQTDSRHSWRVLVGAGLVAAFGVPAVWFGTLGLFLKPLERDLGWTRADIGFSITLTTLLVPVLVPAAGWLIDRVRLRPLILAGIVLQSICIATNSRLGGSILNFYAMFVATMILGMGASLMTLSKVVQGWFDKSLGKALGILFACGSVGGIVQPLFAQALMDRIGWREAYLVLAATSLLAAGLAASLLVDEPLLAKPAAAPVRETGSQAPPTSMLSLLRNRVWWALAVWNALFGFAASGIGFHMASLLQDRGATPAQSAVALSLGGTGLLVGTLVSGWLLDRVPARRIASVLMLGPLCAVLVLLASTNVAVGMLSSLVFGLCSGTEGNLSALLIGRYFGTAMYGRAYSTQIVAIGAGAGVAPWLMGLMQQRTGNYDLALIVSAAAFGAAALAAWLLPGTAATPAARDVEPHPV